jgi:hypothetical protein
MAMSIYDEKFLTDIQFLSGTLPIMAVEDDDLKRPTQEQEERCAMSIGFEFHRGLKNSATTSQASVRQLAITNPIDGPAQPPIETSSTTIQSSELALSEI